MVDLITWPIETIGLAEAFQKLGEKLFGKDWTFLEPSLKENFNICCPIEELSPCFFVCADYIGSASKNKNYKKNLKDAKKFLWKFFDEKFQERNISLADWLKKCEYFLGEEQLYKTILKIDHKEAVEKNKNKIFIKIIEFLLRFSIAVKSLEKIILSRQLIPSMRHKETGIEKEIPYYCLNSECKTQLFYNVSTSECLFYEIVNNSDGSESLMLREGFLFFKEEDIKKYLLHLGQSASSTARSGNLDDDKFKRVIQFAQRKDFPDYLMAIIDTILELDMTRENQPMKEQVVDHLKEKGLSGSLAKSAGTIARHLEMANGGYYTKGRSSIKKHRKVKKVLNTTKG